ncbi:amino acid deaminase/aldolase [Pseudenhygromyxa sp. WMMC2535]|uniref:amino acid deaminase/aldolase n=1 Tax=Pseudenhygromyxa sp. WMMC2535 TaxID=2712867 RepID=UPI001556D606|nr:amino acid deaminase/aldolase [Pseudenhygromyxa sp. WMMC2535]NVB38302.1 amino acid deaminase/aldolase [Pseudenhygromyxa sp. WMMC2535]
MGTREYERLRRAIAGRRLPCAFVDLDRFDANAETLVARAGGKALRVASKSLRCVALLRRVLAREGFAGIMAYSPGEAAWLHDQGFDDILVAYPSVERLELAAVIEGVARGASIRLMVDDRDQVLLLERLVAAAITGGLAARPLELCVDLDVSNELPGLHLGVRRSPLRDLEALLELAALIAECEHLKLVGLMGYEAQIAGVPDDLPGQRARNLLVRAAAGPGILALQAHRRAAVEALRGEGFALALVNGGGTGSLESSREDASLTELSAGSGLFAPTLFDHYRSFAHHPAAGFALPVVRRPTQTIVTCAGGGYVASGPGGDDRLPQPWLPPGGRLLEHEGAGEVQTPVAFPSRVQLALGEPVFFRHAKAGELCERFSSLLLIRAGEVVDVVPTYRGEGQCWL